MAELKLVAPLPEVKPMAAALHAVLSPSSAERWTHCVGSPAMELGLPDTAGIWADEGTAAHFLGAECLTHKAVPADYMGRLIRVPADGSGAYFASDTHPDAPEFTEFQVNEEMIEAITRYVEGVRARVQMYRDAGATVELMVEQRLPITSITGERNAAGTSDVVIVAAFDGYSVIEVIDLKYGRGVRVNPVRNLQLMIYAWAAALKFAALHQFRSVVVSIHQPRVAVEAQAWEVSIEDLEREIGFVVTQADMARSILESPATATQYLSPSDDACRFCKAKAKCPALAGRVIDAFEAVDDSTAAEVPADRLSEYMALTGLMEDWIAAVRAETERRLLAGTPVAGWKLVEGRRGARKYRDVSAVEKLLVSRKLMPETIYEPRELRSPAKMEKSLKKAYPHIWMEVEQQIEQADGKPSVAPEGDSRPMWSPPSTDKFVSYDASDLV